MSLTRIISSDEEALPPLAYQKRTTALSDDELPIHSKVEAVGQKALRELLPPPVTYDTVKIKNGILHYPNGDAYEGGKEGLKKHGRGHIRWQTAQLLKENGKTILK